jgi:hypothetical protein
MTDTVTEPTLPGMPAAPEPKPLWAVYTAGSDEFIAQASREDAELAKTLFDRLDARNAGNPVYPRCAAEVVPWPGSREEHAEALRGETREN